MGSASREALASVETVLTGLGSQADLATAEDLFAAGRVVADSAQLRAVISDPSADPTGKSALVKQVFAKQLTPAAVTIRFSVACVRSRVEPPAP